MPCSCGDSKCSCAEKCICPSKLCMCISCLCIKGKVTKEKPKRKQVDSPSVTEHHNLPEVIKNKASCSHSAADTNSEASSTQSQDSIEISNPGESDCEVILIKSRNPKYKIDSSAKSSKTGNTDIKVVDLSQPELINLYDDNESDCEIVFERRDRSVSQEHCDNMGKENTVGTVNILPDVLKDKEPIIEQAENISQEGSSVEDHKGDINDDQGSLVNSADLQPQKKLRLSDTKDTDLPLSVNFETKSQPDSSVPERLDFDDPKNENNANTATDGSKQDIENTVLPTISESMSVSSVEESVQSENKSPVLINTDTDDSVIPSEKDEDENKMSNCDQSVTYSNSGTQNVLRGRQRNRNRKRSCYNRHQSLESVESEKKSPVLMNTDTDDSVIPSKKDEDRNEVSNCDQSVTTSSSGTETVLRGRQRNRNRMRSRYNRHQFLPIWRNNPSSATPEPFVDPNAVYVWEWQQNWTHTIEPWRRNFDFYGNQSSNICSRKYMPSKYMPSMNRKKYWNKKIYFKSNLTDVSSSTSNVASTSRSSVAATTKPNISPTSKPNVASTSTLTVASKSTVNVASESAVNVASEVTLNVSSETPLKDASSSTLIVASKSTMSVASDTTLKDVSSSTLTVESESTLNDTSVFTKNVDSNLTLNDASKSALNDAFSVCVKKETLDEEEYAPITIKKEPGCADVEQENIFIKKEMKQEIN